MENKLVATSGEREGGRGNIEVGEQEVQIIRYKISYKDILYNRECRQYFIIAINGV